MEETEKISSKIWNKATAKKALRISAWVGAGLLFLFLVLLLLVQIYEDKIGTLVLRELNKTLKHEITVGEIDLSLVQTFPKVGVVLRQTVVPDANKATLLKAETMRFRFGVWGLLSGRITLDAIYLAEGSLNIITDKQGRPNYDIFKPTDEEEESKEVRLDIREAIFENMDLIYQDKPAQQLAMIDLEHLQLSGAFSDTKFDLDSDAEMTIKFLEIKGEELLTGRSVGYDARLNMDLATGSYAFEQVRVFVESTTFEMAGSVKTGKDFTDFDLKLESPDGSLLGVIALLPQNRVAFLDDFDTRGDFFVKSTVKGRLSAAETPAIALDFGLKNGYLNGKRLGADLKNVSFDVHFENEAQSQNGKSFVEMLNFEGELLGERLELSLFVEDFDDPMIDFRMEGQVAVNETFRLLNNPAITEGAGKVTFKNLLLEGKLSDMRSLENINKVTATGVLLLEDVALKYNGEDLKMSNGKLSVSGDRLKMEDFRVAFANNSMRLDGSFEHLIPVFLQKKGVENGIKLDFKTRVVADKIDVDRLLQFVAAVQGEADTTAQNPADSTQNAGSYEDFLAAFEGSFDINIQWIHYTPMRLENTTGELIVSNGQLSVRNVRVQDLKYGDITGEELAGDVVFRGDVMTLQAISMRIFGGKLRLDSDIFLNEKIMMKGLATCENLNVKTLFEQMNNFEQEVVVAKNLSGRLDGTVQLEIHWDAAGNTLYDQLYALADVTMTEGELIDFKMLEDFSKFVKLEDLKRVKFTNLSNKFEVKDRRLTIPAMLIQNNAANFKVGGWHDFDFNFEYDIELNAGQTLANKFRRFNPNREALADKDGWLKVFVHLFGDAEKYDFEYKFFKAD